ncbi:MAG: efflux RND transporter periplasmic adaptor subunit [Acidobacteriota bacterium]
MQAQLAAQKAEIARLRALFSLRGREVAALKVRAGVDGVLQEVSVEVGQQVAAGSNLGRIAQPETLIAELRIPETQAKDITVGQAASIDARNGIIPGQVIRIDPAVREGTVTVDVSLGRPLPPWARPDLSVDGTIEIERLEDVLYVGRPAHGQSDSLISLFKLVREGEEAVRVQVRLGRSSVNTIEVLEGLREDDRVILSDMSRWDGEDRIRLN